MISIGDFARLGRVSVRMLRHYDQIGLLQPMQVDSQTGYRFYQVEQLHRLNRIVALKDLGLRLEQVRAVVDEELSPDELRAMLRLRQAELESQILDSHHRLARVQARLRLIDMEDGMTEQHVATKTVTSMSVVGLTAFAGSATQEEVGPVIGPMYPKIIGLLAAAGVTPIGPSVAYYTPEPERSEDAVRVHATFPVDVDAVAGLEWIDIPGAEVASLIFRGSMEGVDAAYQTFNAWVRSQGYTATGYAREIYLEVPENTADWVTEIQVEFSR